MQDAAASIRKHVDAESSMLDTHASLAKELQDAESLVKVCRPNPLFFYVCQAPLIPAQPFVAAW